MLRKLRKLQHVPPFQTAGVITQSPHKAVIGQHEASTQMIGSHRVLPTAAQTQTQRSILERPPLPPEGV